jgi:hypothetical protein
MQAFRRAGALLLFFPTLTALLAGCAAPHSEVSVAAPGEGDRAEYRGSDGSRLSVTLGPAAMRADPWGIRVPVVLLSYEFRPPSSPNPGWSTYTFEEAVDHEGRIVQHTALCAIPEPPQNNAGACHDDRLEVNFHSWAWPGALGAAPLWWQGKMPTSIPARSGEAFPLGFEATPLSDGCVAAEFRGPSLSDGAFPITVGNGKATFCASRSFPTSFQSSSTWAGWFTRPGPVQYDLEAFIAAAGTEAQRPAATERARTSPLRFVDFNDPLYKLQSADGLPFPSSEAVDAAAQADQGVADYVQAHPKAIAAAAILFRSARSSGGPMVGGSSETLQRDVQLADSDGSCLRLVVQRQQSVKGNLPLTENSTSYAVKKVSKCVGTPFDSARISHRQAEFASAVEWGRELTGLVGLEYSLIGYSHWAAATGWTSNAPPSWNPYGYELRIAFPDPAPQQQGALVKAYFYTMMVDGPSGTLDDIMMPKSKAPFIGHP